MMVIITGASGYIGSHITKNLVNQGVQVRALVRNMEKVNKEGRLAGLDVELVEADVTEKYTLTPAFENAHVVIHTVAIAIEKGENTYERINILGTANVIKAAQEAGIRRFINLSQLGADSTLPYRFLASKGRAQEYVTLSGLDWTAFKPSVIWGPEDEFANTFARLIPITPIIFPNIDKNARFQPVWVEDLVTCIVNSLDDLHAIMKEYEIGGPEILTLEEIEKRVLAALGTKRILVPFPKSVLKSAVGMMERFIPNPPVTQSLLELLQVDNVTRENAISDFVEQPRAFTSSNIAAYMREFRINQTLSQYFGG